MDTASTGLEPDVVSSILPSYQMYNSLYRGQVLQSSKPPGYSCDSRGSTPPVAILDDGLDEDTNLVDRLRGLDDADVDGIEIAVHFTKDVCKPGVTPQHVQNLQPLRQGQYLHGYITIDNLSHKLYKFDQVFVFLEGVITRKDGSKHTFLQMLEFFASYNPARINRLPEENADPFVPREEEEDPCDGRILSFKRQSCILRQFARGGRYKRFFSFRLPELALDSQCSEGVPDHLVLPPSDPLGVHYAVSTRLVTRRRDLPGTSSSSPEFIMLKQQEAMVPVDPVSPLTSSEVEREELSERIYANLVERIRSHLEPDTATEKGAYTSPVSSLFSERTEVNRRVFGRPQLLGEFEVSSKKVVQTVYLHENTGGITVPLSLTFTAKNSASAPDVRRTLVNLEEITYETEFPMPFTIGAFLFNHGRGDLDHTIEDMRQRATALYNLLQATDLQLEASLVNAIKAVCKLQWRAKTHPMTEFNACSTVSKRANALPWQRSGVTQFTKLMHIDVDHRHFCRETLLPSFQTCHVGRAYFLKVTLLLTTKDTLCLRMPLVCKG